jgi:branched-chain amino acid aminotransferase
LSNFDEIIAAGTAAALVPIKSITMETKGDKITINGGSSEPGPICAKLLSTLKGIQQGKIADSFGWLNRVKEPAGFTSNKNLNGSTNGIGKNVDELP